MSLALFTFNEVALKVVTVNGKQWCRAKEVCKALEYKKDTSDVIGGHCSTENITHRYQLSGSPMAGEPVNWPSDSQRYDLYITEKGLYELVFSSQEPLAKAFRKHCCNVMFPHIQQQMTDRVIEEKEAALALLNDELQTIQYENVGLQDEIKTKDKTIKDLINN